MNPRSLAPRRAIAGLPSLGDRPTKSSLCRRRNSHPLGARADAVAGGFAVIEMGGDELAIIGQLASLFKSTAGLTPK